MEQQLPHYPESIEVTMGLRPFLHPALSALAPEISEFTFANIYLFRQAHGYRVSRLPDSSIIISGREGGRSFFMCPSGLPEPGVFSGLLKDFDFARCVSEKDALTLASKGFLVEEDRANFDYIYKRRELSEFSGRRYHAKKNLVNYFAASYKYEGRPLRAEYIPDAVAVLEKWSEENGAGKDYLEAKEALLNCERLSLCGGIYYVEDIPEAYILGEELNPATFVIHFEKGIGGYKGLLQFVNKSFAGLLPQKYEFINREQDLGDPGLRASKEGYRPCAFVKKFKVRGL
ncbi:MAG: phosphatidylglycerol lysyltransferase domain-containing protein [Deltaproteobacteria bacterium]